MLEIETKQANTPDVVTVLLALSGPLYSGQLYTSTPEGLLGKLLDCRMFSRFVSQTLFMAEMLHIVAVRHLWVSPAHRLQQWKVP